MKKQLWLKADEADILLCSLNFLKTRMQKEGFVYASHATGCAFAGRAVEAMEKRIRSAFEEQPHD